MRSTAKRGPKDAHANNVGTKLKRIRLSRNITLKTLAEKTGLTNGYLSRIENSQNFPPMSTLSRIAEGLGIDISYFFISIGKKDKENLHIVIDRQSASVEKAFLTAFEQEGQQYHYRHLFPEKQGKNLQPFIVSPDFQLGPAHRGEGEELVHVLEGSMEFVYGDETYTFSQGDTYYFDTQIPFTGRSLGKKRAKLLVVYYPYRRS
jgi:transcriptional regulator with XRE-family HTH domain